MPGLRRRRLRRPVINGGAFGAPGRPLPLTNASGRKGPMLWRACGATAAGEPFQKRDHNGHKKKRTSSREAAPQARQSIGPFSALLYLLFLLFALTEEKDRGRPGARSAPSSMAAAVGGRPSHNGGFYWGARAPQCFTGGREPPNVLLGGREPPNPDAAECQRRHANAHGRPSERASC